MRKLRFLTNDALVLMHVAINPNSTLREIANAVDITERALQPVLTALEQDGLIERERQGRGTYYRVHYKRLMRHPLEGPLPTVRDLVRELFELGRRLDED
ncbi:MAG TPA: winged helix-turn-helix domain-containing protein, partial [Dehalococcoidia bacterium]